MLSFKKFLSEGFVTKGLKLLGPDIDDEGGHHYSFPAAKAVGGVYIAPKEDNAHPIMFTLDGEFHRTKPYSVSQAKHVLSHVVSALKHHSKKTGAKEYSYQTAHAERDAMYQRMAKAAGVKATNTMASEMFKKERPVNEKPK